MVNRPCPTCDGCCRLEVPVFEPTKNATFYRPKKYERLSCWRCGGLGLIDTAGGDPCTR